MPRKPKNLGWDACGHPISLPAAALDALAWLQGLHRQRIAWKAGERAKLDACIGALEKQLKEFFPTPLRCATGDCECHGETKDAA